MGWLDQLKVIVCLLGNHFVHQLLIRATLHQTISLYSAIKHNSQPLPAERQHSLSFYAEATVQKNGENKRKSVTYHPRRQTCRWWSSQWRRAEIWVCCRCSCQTLASPRAAPASSPRPSATSNTRASKGGCWILPGFFVFFNAGTCAKYSSEMRPAHSMQSCSGLQGFDTSAHLISILFISRRFSGEFLMLAWPSASLFTLCREKRCGFFWSGKSQTPDGEPRSKSCAYVCAALFQGGHRLVDAVHKLADVLEVSGHLRSQHHVNDGLPQRPELVPARGEGGQRERLCLIHDKKADVRGPTCRCSWRCCSCRLARWVGRRGRRGGSPTRPCRCRGWPARSRRYTGRSWFAPGGPRRAQWPLSERRPRPAGPGCPGQNSRGGATPSVPGRVAGLARMLTK